MNQVTETIEEKLSALIVAKYKSSLVNHLVTELKKYNIEIFFSSVLPRKNHNFSYCFFIDPDIKINHSFLKGKKSILIFQNHLDQAHAYAKDLTHTQSKVVHIDGDIVTPSHINKILWFTFSKTTERLLQLTAVKKQTVKVPRFTFSEIKLPSRRTFASILLGLFIFIHIAFAAPLGVASYLMYKSVTALKEENIGEAQNLNAMASPFLFAARALYTIPRSTLLLFSLSLLPDDIFDINTKTDDAVKKVLALQQNLGQLSDLLFKKEKTSDEKRVLQLRLHRIREDINGLSDDVSSLSQKLPNIGLLQNRQTELRSTADLLSRLKKILPHLDSLLAQGTTRKYLMLFANNMELRPGGGFIGSFGILTITDYTIESIKVYDVYDADGQLIAHVDPPDAIRRYLGQPHWFLRDSAFSPDFLENYIQAKYFLEKEMGFNDFSGAILITTTGIQNILGAFGDIILPDFHEKINDKNFYLKAQLHAESEFFPGSTQKKNFLSSLVHYLMLNLNTVSHQKLAQGLKKSLNEKQLVLYFDDPQLQEVIDTAYWAGRTINPGCNDKDGNCTTDYIFPFDANLGVNKANFFVSRTNELKITIDPSGNLNHTYTVRFSNQSHANVFPGGTYLNYFQILLPKNVRVKRITKDGTLVENFDESTDIYKKIGVLVEVKPQSKTELQINYDLNTQLPKGSSLYQLITQKQIGMANSDFSIRYILPKNVHSTNKNFSALVNDNQIIYNTSLSTDKIFFMELVRE